MQVKRDICALCWRKPKQNSKFCEFGEHGHSNECDDGDVNAVVKGDALGAALAPSGGPTSFKTDLSRAPGAEAIVEAIVARDIATKGVPSRTDEVVDPNSAQNSFIGAVLEERRGYDLGMAGDNNLHVNVR